MDVNKEMRKYLKYYNNIILDLNAVWVKIDEEDLKLTFSCNILVDIF